MILKILNLFYAWLWNVPAWQPKGDPFDVFAIAMGVLCLDVPVVTCVVLGILNWLAERSK